MEDWSDEQLLVATPTTPAAFAVFYRRHEAAVLGYFMRRSGNAEVAADLAGETFAAALLGARRYRSDRGEGLAWLYGIARHRLMHGPRRRLQFPWRRMLVPALAIGCAVVALVTLPGRSTGPAQEELVVPPVPEATLALSHALTQAPDPPPFSVNDPTIPHAELPAVANAYEEQTPYPPGGRDVFDWASTGAAPDDPGSISYHKDVQWLVEWRSACIWLRSWLASQGEARQAAGVVLADVPHWPALRDHPGNWAGVPAQAAAGDVAALAAQNQYDCEPWRNSQRG